MEEIDITIERKQYYNDEISGSNCPECNAPLIAKNQTVMLYVVARHDEAQFMTNAVGSTFCPNCPVVVFDKQRVREAAEIGMRHDEVEAFGIAGIVNLDAVPEEKASMELGTDDNPVPLVPFLEMKRQPVIAAPKISRNAPCPCGSGKKYKRCCGRK